jgi:plasmid stability protein
MPTVQVRDIPDEVHRVYRSRAAAAGMSLQAFLRAELIAGAQVRSPAEIAAEVSAELAGGATGYSRASATALIRGCRERS